MVGSNVTIQVWGTVLSKFSETIPPVLYFQLDNIMSRENKNPWKYSYIS